VDSGRLTQPIYASLLRRSGQVTLTDPGPAHVLREGVCRKGRRVAHGMGGRKWGSARSQCGSLAS
jgi:hypothetical protein